MIPIDLSGRAALVTGGGRGIGRAIALKLAQAGADVMVTARTEEQLQETVRGVRALGRKGALLAGDAALAETAEAAVERAVAELGGLDILVNNAGMEMMKPLLDATPADFDRVMEVNVKSMMLFTQAAGRRMIEHKSGRIVNLASTGSFIAGPNQSLYHASKAACAHFTRAMAIEWARHNITVNAVAPGWINTDLIAHLTSDQEKLANYVKNIPMRRLGEPAEVASVVLFLCSDLAAYMTGSIVIVDGGLMIP
ncbi:MAG TPA: SDR family oxidoreductase [bacterium]|nr:SDR family oxidoreductase [bacterium]